MALVSRVIWDEKARQPESVLFLSHPRRRQGLPSQSPETQTSRHRSPSERAAWMTPPVCGRRWTAWFSSPRVGVSGSYIPQGLVLEISSPLSMNEGVEKLPVDMRVSECTRPSPRMLQDSSASKKSSWFMATAPPFLSP